MKSWRITLVATLLCLGMLRLKLNRTRKEVGKVDIIEKALSTSEPTCEPASEPTPFFGFRGDESKVQVAAPPPSPSRETVEAFAQREALEIEQLMKLKG